MILACPFCETGGDEAAVFTILVFGLFAAGMVAFAIFHAGSGGLARGLGIENRVLEVEGIRKPEEESDHAG